MVKQCPYRDNRVIYHRFVSLKCPHATSPVEEIQYIKCLGKQRAERTKENKVRKRL